jgi:hypothetical protein
MTDNCYFCGKEEPSNDRPWEIWYLKLEHSIWREEKDGVYDNEDIRKMAMCCCNDCRVDVFNIIISMRFKK